MKIILLQDIKTLGNADDTITVKDGYARNFLIPKKLAVPATGGALKALEAKRKMASLRGKKEKKKCEELREVLSRLSLTIPTESGEDDKLFGSVTSDVIFHALQQEGININKKSIKIAEPIRKLGIYNVEVTLHPEVKADLRVWVVKK